jgi:D-alanyl-D-alanine carboxypeptidase
MLSRQSATSRILILAIAVCAAWSLAPSQAKAEATLLMEVESGKVLEANNAGHQWYPASITKIMTTYVTLRAIKEGRLSMDTLLTVSPNAVAQAPVKMGFPVGTQITVDNVLKMLLVKSANDMAVVLAEGVGGSIENFAEMMNDNARRLGMTQSHFVNPNGLPADEQLTSPRDMAIVARAVLREFPEYDYLWHLPGIKWGKRVQRNYNTLLGRYPGTDGMKTGFICASGFNLIATATRDNKRLMAVVFGAPSASARAIKAAQLLESGFNAGPLAWLTPSLGTIENLPTVDEPPPNLRDEMCGKHRKRPATEDEDDSAAVAGSGSPDSPYGVFLSSLRAPKTKQNLLQQEQQLGEPVPVFTGPPKKQVNYQTASAPKDSPTPAKTIAPSSGNRGVAVAGVMPWTSLSPASLANSPPSGLANAPGNAEFIPIPRARPKLPVQRVTQTMSARPSSARPSARSSARTPAATSNSKTTRK